MKERSEKRTRKQWFLREFGLKWKKTRTRRHTYLKIGVIGCNLLGTCFLVFCGMHFTLNKKPAEAVAVIFEESEIMAKEVKEFPTEEKEATESSSVIIVGEVLPTETVEELIAEHTISYPASVSISTYENRNKNMELAANAINGCILGTGERFYWSKVVGKTTAEKGYLIAGVIKNGKGGKDLGGGVCQVSSTVYSAAYDAGIIQEGKYHAEKHTLKSKYINAKVDHEATVAIDHEPITDFWFENTLEHPIRIEAMTDKHTVTVKIYLLK